MMRNNSIKIISYLSVLIVLIINACDKKSVETNNSSPEYIKMIMDYRAEQARNEFFHISVNGEDAMEGIQQLPLKDGDIYTFKLMKW